MYKDMYKQYSPSELQYAYPFSFNGKGVDYLNSLEQESYTWDYGDTVDIPFLIQSKYRRFPLELTVYNFRYEPIYKLADYADEEGKIHLIINEQESKNIFKKGLYYCGIQSFEYIDSYEGEGEEEPDKKWATTLLPPNACLMRVV